MDIGGCRVALRTLSSVSRCRCWGHHKSRRLPRMGKMAIYGLRTTWCAIRKIARI